MFKKILYLISLLLGFTIFLSIFRKSKCSSREIFPIKEEEDLTTESKSEVQGLNSRQLEILKLIRKRKVLLPSDIYSLHPQVTSRTLRRDMTTLVNKNIVKQEGNTKDTKYILIEK